MKQVGIITLTKDLNYGNRLQNYAVECLVSKYGIPHTLFNTTWSAYGTTSKYRSYLGIPFAILKNRKSGISRQITALFDRFNNKYIHMADKYDKESEMELIVKKYDIFITGSDQVWNPYWEFIGDKEYLTFATSKKKIALSASFGVSEIPEEKKELISGWLNGLDVISVRENRAAEIVKELTGRDAQVLIDPTMCIDAKKWIEIARRPFLFNTKTYVLMYVLGDMQRDCLSSISEYCNKIGAQLVILKQNRIFDKYPIGPREYLYLIANAKYVITDSFHGSVFSILFHRNLGIFHREGQEGNQDMMSRLETLMEKFSLEDCLMKDNVFDFTNITLERWDEIERKLDVYRAEVNQFLANYLM